MGAELLEAVSQLLSPSGEPCKSAAFLLVEMGSGFIYLFTYLVILRKTVPEDSSGDSFGS